jgi:hypothetical protein
MIRNVLSDYLDSVKERDFDFPLTSLLYAMDFFDIHLTDGGSEFGKDFIAKKKENGTVYQYVIQSKRGDINQPDFRNKIMGQLLEAVILKRLSHSQLDSSLPQKTILVTTGQLIDNAFLSLRELNDQFKTEYKKEPVEFWGKDQLIEYATKFGLSGVHQVTAKGLSGFAQFYLVYARSIEGTLTDREIEEYSRFWLDSELDYKKRILRATIEADVLASKLLANGQVYESIVTYLALARLLMAASYENSDSSIQNIYNELIDGKLIPFATEFLNLCEQSWANSDRSLVRACSKENAFPMLHYLVWCQRIIEIYSMRLFLDRNVHESEKITSFVMEILKTENGCGHIPSDRYSVSVLWCTLALIRTGRLEIAKTLIKRSVVWLCDRIEKGYGLARYEASEFDETVCLLGFPFEFFKMTRNNSSFFATALADLAAFAGDRELYANVVNDFKACGIAYHYWQFPDTESIFRIESDECLTYPNIPHSEAISENEPFAYSVHLKDEPNNFRIVEKLGLSSLVLVSLLLRDRYFPKVWSRLVHG